MKRSIRFATVVLLAGLVQVLPAGDVSAQNTPWKFKSKTDPLTDKATGSVISASANGSHIAFNCVRGEKVADFLALAATRKPDSHTEGNVEVAWRTDHGAVHNEVWGVNTASSKSNGVGIVGRAAYEFAIATARAQNRIVFRNANGTIVYEAKGSTNAIEQLLDFCGLKK